MSAGSGGGSPNSFEDFSRTVWSEKKTVIDLVHTDRDVKNLFEFRVSQNMIGMAMGVQDIMECIVWVNIRSKGTGFSWPLQDVNITHYQITAFTGTAGSSIPHTVSVPDKSYFWALIG